MTEHGESAVLVLAAGRRHPDAVGHPQGAAHAGRPQHAVARSACGGQGRPRSTSSSCSATTATASPPLSAELAGDARPPDRHRGAGTAAGHRARRRLRAGRAARRLRRHRRGHLGRRPAAGRRHARRPDRHARLEARRGDGADHDAGRPDRLRPHPAHPGPRGHRHRRAGRRHPVAAGHQRGQRRRVRVRHRRICARRWAGCGPTTPSRSCTSPTSSRSSGRTARSCAPSTSTTPRWWQASTTGCSWPSWPPS